MPISYSGLKNLKELYLTDDLLITDLKLLPNNLVNFERISFACAYIMLIITRPVEMQPITIYNLIDHISKMTYRTENHTLRSWKVFFGNEMGDYEDRL